MEMEKSLEQEMNELAVENAIIPEEEKDMKRAKAQQEAVSALQNLSTETPDENDELTDEEDVIDEPEDIQPESKPKKKRAPRSKKIISIDGILSTETQDSKNRAALLDLTESLKAGKILTDYISGVEVLGSNVTAVLYHGDVYKVIIPVKECIEIPERFLAGVTGSERASKESYALNMRVGTEVDYIVLGVDNENKIIVASRIKAMQKKILDYYIRPDRQGNTIMYEGAIVEARIVAVNQKGIVAEVFGVETFISLPELSYHRIQDATLDYYPGDRINVKITELIKEGNKKEGYKISIKASVKQTEAHPYEKLSNRFMESSVYAGKVTMVDTNGIFVKLDGGLDCLCKYPERGPRPTRESSVTVRITHKNDEAKRLFGIITHVRLASR